jgi:hypothetical protein
LYPAPRLAWQRYPRVDGYIHPWTSSGKFRPGLRFKGEQRGRCFLVDETARSALSCLAGNSRYDACFPRRRPWQRGELAACSWGPGSTTFTRWVITHAEAGRHPPTATEHVDDVNRTIEMRTRRPVAIESHGNAPTE